MTGNQSSVTFCISFISINRGKKREYTTLDMQYIYPMVYRTLCSLLYNLHVFRDENRRIQKHFTTFKHWNYTFNCKKKTILLSFCSSFTFPSLYIRNTFKSLCPSMTANISQGFRMLSLQTGGKVAFQSILTSNALKRKTDFVDTLMEKIY